MAYFFFALLLQLLDILFAVQRAVRKVMNRELSDAPLHIVFALFDQNKDNNLAAAELLTVSINWAPKPNGTATMSATYALVVHSGCRLLCSAFC